MRTIGNAVPAAVVARLRARVGAAFTDAMLLTATLFTAEELAATGFVSKVAPRGTLETTTAEVVRRIREAAPLSVVALEGAAPARRGCRPDPSRRGRPGPLLRQ